MAEADQDHVVFRQVLPEHGLEVSKTYRLTKVPENKLKDADYPAYHLEFEIAVKNIGRQSRKVAYRLDGPNGLPREGWWYANKVSRTWGGAGLRDVLVLFDRGDPKQISCPDIADGKYVKPWQDEALTFIGVDAQYFSAVLVPQDDATADIYRVAAAAHGQRRSRCARTPPTRRSASSARSTPWGPASNGPTTSSCLPVRSGRRFWVRNCTSNKS